jgi:hypothetical protein
MVAAEMFNQSAGHAAPVYGCVTTGEVWQFLELTGTTAAIDQRRYYLDDVRGILGVIQAIISRAHAAGVPRSKPAGF